jgi:hypothetical protein
VLLGIGQGRSLRWLSSSTGRPAMEDSFTVEVTGKDCWPTTPVTVVALKMSASRVLSNSVARGISLQQNHRKQSDGSTLQSMRCPCALVAPSRNVVEDFKLGYFSGAHVLHSATVSGKVTGEPVL